MKRKIFISLALILLLTVSACAAQAVRVTSAAKFERDSDGFHARIITPKISGLADAKAQSRLNRKFASGSAALVKQFSKETAEAKKDMPGQTIHLGYDHDYKILTDSARNYSFCVYTVNTSGSSSTELDFYNIDKRGRRLMTLGGMFRRGADYTGTLSKYILSEMKRMNKNGSGAFWTDSKAGMPAPFRKISKDQDFYINKGGKLVICFDKYEVAPGSSGTPEFVIPNRVIKSIKK